MGKGIKSNSLDYMKLIDKTEDYEKTAEIGLDEEEKENIVFHSIFEVIDFLENANIDEQELSEFLEGCKKRKDLSLKEKSSIRKKAKKELKKLQGDIDNVLDLLTDYTTFDSKVILPILAKYLSITEGEEYEVKLFKLSGETYYIISTLANIEYLEELRVRESCETIEEYFEYLKNNKYICILKDKKINILDGVSLDEYFSNYPNLIRLGYAIVNLRLRRPEFEDEEIFNTILGIVPKEINLSCK